MATYRRRRSIVTFILLAVIAGIVLLTTPSVERAIEKTQPTPVATTAQNQSPALEALSQLTVKGRAPKTDYSRDQFGAGWETQAGCDTRNIILNRDLKEVQVDQSCNILSGLLNDPYTGKEISFKRGSDTSSLIQIDHVVALSNAWQTGAAQLSPLERSTLANDPLELLAVDGPANQQKSDGDAATWLPSNKAFRCQYIARQIAVKLKYKLWVTASESEAMKAVLQTCPAQTLPAK